MIKTATFALIGLSLFATGLARSASADPKSFYYQRYLQRKAALLEQGGGLDILSQLFTNLLPEDHHDLTNDTVAGTFDQRVNHDDPKDTRSFKQRYYVNSSYASGANAPVIYYICGEAPCTGREFGGATSAYASKLKAHMVALEHRYYGKSVPLDSLSTDALKYLSTDAALKDLAAFQMHATANLGLKGKWIAIGGSYPGSLSAYYRLKYPNLVVGSLASSGPVLAKANFEEYDLTVSTVAGQQCADAMRAVVAKVESTLKDPAKLAAMKALFGATDVKNNIDFLYVIADMGAIAIQYGSRDEFCDSILKASDPVQGYATIGKQLFAAFGITAVEDSFQGAESANPNDYLGTFGMRSWLYQDCTEYGYWQVAYHDPKVSVRSSLISLPYHNEVCGRMFGIPQEVQTDKVNEVLYKPLLDPAKASNILFTNGSTDPWSTLSINPANHNDTNPNTTAFLIDGAAHCDDLGGLAGSGPVKQAQDLFQSLYKTWLHLDE